MFGVMCPGMSVEASTRYCFGLLLFFDWDGISGSGVRFAKLNNTKRTIRIFEALKKKTYKLM